MINPAPLPASAAVEIAPAPGWRARLDLELAPRGGRTCVIRCRHQGPLRVQRPFYPEGEVGHIYILHPPGGLVAGDQLTVSAHCRPGARALLTTPAAGRVYHSNRAQLPQTQNAELTVDAGASCEWLPQENILFAGALAHNRVCVRLAPGADYTGWEITCLGRPAAGELFASGRLVQRCEVWRDGRPLLIETSSIAGSSPQLTAPWGLQGRSACATLVSTQVTPALVHQMRAIIDAHRAAWQNGEPPLAAVTALPELLVVRALADSAAAIKALFIPLWQELRLARWGVAGSAPRIWAS